MAEQKNVERKREKTLMDPNAYSTFAIIIFISFELPYIQVKMVYSFSNFFVFPSEGLSQV